MERCAGRRHSYFNFVYARKIRNIILYQQKQCGQYLWHSGFTGNFIIMGVLFGYHFYFGAEFTKAYAMKYGSEIHPNSYAVTTKQVEVETGKQSVQKTEATTHEVKTIPPPK